MNNDHECPRQMGSTERQPVVAGSPLLATFYTRSFRTPQELPGSQAAACAAQNL